MAFVVADRVNESTTTTGTGSYALGGAVAGFQTFSAAVSNGDTLYYAATDDDDYEVGLGTYASSGNTLARTTVFSSSNSNNAVNWGAGTKKIFLTYPASKAVVEDASNNVTIGNNLVVGGTVDGRDVATDGTKLNGIEANADVTDTANVTAAGALMDSEVDANIKTLGLPASTTISTFGASLVDDANAAAARTTLGVAIGSNVQAYSSVLANTTASFLTADETKLDFIAVTQNVDLDQMETDIAALANGMVYKGNWDASAGSFPGSGSAQTGWFYYVSVAGTVDNIAFAVGDNIVATTDNASASTYANNWSKHDQTDAVQAVVGLTGSVTKSGLLTALSVEDGADVTDTANVTAAGALMDSEVDADIKTLSLPANTTISAFGKTLVDDTNASTARTTLGLGTAATTAATAYATAAQGTLATNAMPKGGGTFTGAVTVGADTSGYDVKFFGDTSGEYVRWVASEDTLYFPENSRLMFGGTTNVGDLRLYSNSTNAYVECVQANDLIIKNQQNDKDVIIQTDNSSGGNADYFRADGSTGESILYHYGSEKFATKSTGVDVTGNITVSGTVDGVDLQTLNSAVSTNTAKTGITSSQATAITANTAKTTNATHTGEVTGSGALTIASNVVDEANLKVSNSPTNGYFLSAQSGNTGGLTWAQAGGGSTTLGAVGTYGLFRNTASTANFTPGSTRAGSGLRYANTYQYGASYYGSGNTAPSGTWRIMGHCGVYNGVSIGGTSTAASVFVRIS